MRKFVVSAISALLAACAANPFPGYEIQPGTSREAVLARLGTPTRIVRLPAGERLQYSLQPMGQRAWMVDLDAAGKAVRVRQVLNPDDFNRIQPGSWNRDDVEREFGPAAKIDRVASWPGPVMTYRWRDAANSDMFYFVYLDGANVVRRVHPGIEFHNAPDRF
jgi:hypothetical protein